MQSGSYREGFGLLLEAVNSILTLVCVLIPLLAIAMSMVSLPIFVSMSEALVGFLGSIQFLGLLMAKVLVAIIYRLVVPRNWSLWSVFRLTP